EITLPPGAPYIGRPIREVPMPRDSALVAIVRGKRVLVPTPDDPLEAGDEAIFVCTTAAEEDIRRAMLGSEVVQRAGKSAR
ncbi:MAG: TrkA C-terminal domain-containing protein, partial [Dactylosporangium sp.]|nr:TrkA C-terminal domain-containing protein [Dactylosporangium sp.]